MSLRKQYKLLYYNVYNSNRKKNNINEKRCMDPPPKTKNYGRSKLTYYRSAYNS